MSTSCVKEYKTFKQRISKRKNEKHSRWFNRNNKIKKVNLLQKNTEYEEWD